MAQRRQNLYGYLFISPWLLGFFGLFVGPGLYSLYLSFTKYDVLSTPEFIGLKNYVEMFTNDDLFWPSLGRTAYYAIVSVPLSVLGSMFLAILLNSKLRGVTIYRTLFFMPSLVPLVASVVLFKWLLNNDFGIVNQGLRGIGVENPPGWFGDSNWAIPSLVLIRLWAAIGGTQIQHITVQGAAVPLSAGFKVTEALAVVAPGAGDVPDEVASPPTLSWKDDSSEDKYSVEVFDARGTLVWQDMNVPRVTGSGNVNGRDASKDCRQGW